MKLTRESYQKIGYELFTRLGAKKLLNLVMGNSDIKILQKVIFDGVRHISVLREIKNISNSVKVIFLEANESIRYFRYCDRKSTGTNVSLDDFRKIDNHPIEQGIQELLKHADHIIDASKSFDLVNREVSRILKMAGFKVVKDITS